MKKLFLTLVFAVIAVVCANAQLLYKISGNNLEKPSYIIGTYHLAPASFADSIPGANDALASVGQVCGELDMSEMEGVAGSAKLMKAMMLPDGKSLADILTEDELAKLNAYMNETMGADLSNPMINAQLGKMTPAAISTQLQLVYYMKKTPGFNPLALIDSYFQKEAKKAGKPVIGFETIDFQISVLYTGTPIERQIQSLFCIIDNKEYSAMVMDQLTKAYFAQDMAAIASVMDEELGAGCERTPEEDEALIYGRNADWAEKMPAMMAAESTLFVVGAAHLPGERGVLELLKNKGFVIEAVK